jgi:hypothetical protein
MKAIVRPAVFAVLLIAVSASMALVEAAPHFHGTYAWTGFRSCVLANQPFVGEANLIPGGAFLSRVSSSESGTITFNLDGTGFTEGRASLMTMSTAADPVLAAGAGLGVAKFINNFTFTVDHVHATIDTDSTGVTAETMLGSGKGNITTGIGLRNRFQIVRGDMLVSAPQMQINPEKVFLSSGVTLHRICTPHSFTGTRLP